MGGSIPQSRIAATDQDGLVRLFLRDANRHRRMTAEEERESAFAYRRLRKDLWVALLSYHPHTKAIALACAETRDGARQAASSVVEADAERSEHRGKPLRLQAASETLAELMVLEDGECGLATALVGDLDRVARRMQPEVLKVKFPRRGSRPFAEHHRGCRRALRAVVEARNRLVRANLRLVVKAARGFARRGDSLSDLIQNGNLGLLKAIGRYDVRLGYRFSTYAFPWLRHFIVRGKVRDRAVRFPVDFLDLHRKATESSAALSDDAHREPWCDDVAAELGVSSKKLRAIFGVLEPIAPIAADIPDSTPLADEELGRADDVKTLMDALPRLGDFEREIIERRFGLGGRAPETLVAIGSDHSLSRERIRQIEAVALSKLRSSIIEGQGCTL